MKRDRQKLENELLDLSGRHELSEEEVERVYEIEKELENENRKNNDG